MKKIILFSLFFFCVNLAAQTADTVKWVIYSNTHLNITMNYPSFMQLEDNLNSVNSEMDSSVYLSFTDYPVFGTAADLGSGDSTDTLYIELHQSLDIVVSKSSLMDVAPRYNYLYKDSSWFDAESYEKGWSDEPATPYSINNWYGYETFTPTRVYLKEGGILTTAGDMRVFFLTKKINDTTSFFVFGTRFDFDNAEIFLKNILDSISLIE